MSSAHVGCGVRGAYSTTILLSALVPRAALKEAEQKLRRSWPCDDKVILLAHPFSSLYDLVLIVCDDLYPLQVNSELEAVFGEVGRVCVNCLWRLSGVQGVPTYLFIGHRKYLSPKYFVANYDASCTVNHALASFLYQWCHGFTRWCHCRCRLGW